MIYLSKESNHFITGELAPIFLWGKWFSWVIFLIKTQKSKLDHCLSRNNPYEKGINSNKVDAFIFHN